MEWLEMINSCRETAEDLNHQITRGAKSARMITQGIIIAVLKALQWVAQLSRVWTSYLSLLWTTYSHTFFLK